MSNSCDPEQAQLFIRHNLGPNCLQGLSADKHLFGTLMLFINFRKQWILKIKSADDNNLKKYPVCKRRRVQQCERSWALDVLVPISIRNVYSLASIQRAPESARIVELASVVHQKVSNK